MQRTLSLDDHRDQILERVYTYLLCVCVKNYRRKTAPDTDIMLNFSTRLKPSSYCMGPSSSGKLAPPVAMATVAERLSLRSFPCVPSSGITVADRWS